MRESGFSPEIGAQQETQFTAKSRFQKALLALSAGVMLMSASMEQARAEDIPEAPKTEKQESEKDVEVTDFSFELDILPGAEEKLATWNVRFVRDIIILSQQVIFLPENTRRIKITDNGEDSVRMYLYTATGESEVLEKTLVVNSGAVTVEISTKKTYAR